MSNDVLSETADDRFGSEKHPSSGGRRTLALASYVSSAALGALGGAAAGVMVGIIAGPEGSLAGALIGGAIGAAAAAAVGMDLRERRLREAILDHAPLFLAEEDELGVAEEIALAFPESREPAPVPATVNLPATGRVGG